MSTVDLRLAARNLRSILIAQHFEASPVLDQSETDVVALLWCESPEQASAYLARRFAEVSQRLLSPYVQSGDPAHDARIVLGSYAYLQDLHGVVAA